MRGTPGCVGLLEMWSWLTVQPEQGTGENGACDRVRFDESNDEVRLMGVSMWIEQISFFIYFIGEYLLW